MIDSNYRVYEGSRQKRGDSEYHIEADGIAKMLVVSGPDMDLFDGQAISGRSRPVKKCPLTAGNSVVIRKLFGFTNPKSHNGSRITIGLGDRLGIASAGHIRVIRRFDVFPILAQQSMRELNLTGRTYEDVLAAAVWAVFQEGYTKGYGADGDHLKTYEEVKYALDCGYTMITLDCSEHIRNGMASAPQGVVDEEYAKIGALATGGLENDYINRSFNIGNDVVIEYNRDDFQRMALIYLPAIGHVLRIYDSLIKGMDVDFEVSIDETLTKTSPQSHFFFANELAKHGVRIASLAPRFTGEFQKGIDYRGSVAEFESDFQAHVRIAEEFGYKISVHSGSDKFAVFPSVGKLSCGRYHLKTAGTSWLEAVRVIAERAPQLYREIHAFALERLLEAKQYYHITENTANIADLHTVTDGGLPSFLNQDDSRQVLHVAYGLVLMAKAGDGSPLFRTRIYDVLNSNETEYYGALEKHIGDHLYALGIR